MNLFTERDIAKLESFFTADSHSHMLVRSAGFLASEQQFLTDKFLSDNKSGLIPIPTDDKGFTGVNQIHELLAGITLSSKKSTDERRLVIITDTTKLNRKSQNTLLKSLEEPVPGVYFLILCTDPDNYLATIRSRCSILKLETPTDDQVKFAVESNEELGLDGQASLLAWLQSGRNLSNLDPLLTNQKIRNQKMALLLDAKKYFGSKDYDKYKLLISHSKDKVSALDFLTALTITLEAVSFPNYRMLKEVDTAPDIKGKALTQVSALHKLYKNIENARQKINKNCNVRLAMACLI